MKREREMEKGGFCNTGAGSGSWGSGGCGKAFISMSGGGGILYIDRCKYQKERPYS